MFETPEFLASKVDTEWLDGLIAGHVQAERPDPGIAVICGALHIAEDHVWASVVLMCVWVIVLHVLIVFLNCYFCCCY
jgi:hypothetical protein